MTGLYRGLSPQGLKNVKETTGRAMAGYSQGSQRRVPVPARKSRGRLPIKNRIIELGLQLSANLDIDDLLNTIVNEAALIFKSESASLIFLDEEKEALHFRNVGSSDDLSFLRDLSLKRGEGIAGYVAQEGTPLIINDVQNDPRFSQKADKKTGKITRSMMAVPLRGNDRILGTMEVINKRKGFFTAAELSECQTLASFASVALENARLHSQIKSTLARITSLEESKHELVNLLSHELRTPVTVILSSSSLLAAHIGQLKQEMVQKTAQMIESQTVRLTSLLDDLFVINDIDEIRNRMMVKDFSVKELLEVTLLKFRRSTTEHTIEVQYPGGSDFPPLRADAMKLRHCIFHLLENAVKFSPGGGIIIVRVLNDRARPPYLHIEIEDHGIGIEGKHLGRIFEKFYQVDSSSTRKFGGLGLGLFIVKKVAEIHGGDVQCKSTPSRGSTFTLTLPLFPS
ncbi:MAG: GAF domain-containing sensor histidine kinase [Candidatus Eremiobacteraeota bacterium]|nr:GAF domain-containing sensor histidine kinase [Candidatus Eremiobacteraeota bacterium]